MGIKSVICSALAAFASLGCLAGWFIGASDSPVTGTVITGVLTLFGLLVTAGFALKQSKEEPIANIADIYPIAVLLSIAVIVFSGSCFFGLRLGVRSKHFVYPEFESVLVKSGIDVASLSAADRWRLHLIYWELQSKGRSNEVIQEFFRDTIGAVIKIPEDDRILNDTDLDEILTELREVDEVKEMLAEEHPTFWPGA